MKVSREIKTAIIVLGGILLFIMGFTYLKSSPIFDSSHKYHVEFDNIGGLTVGTAVSINGFQVGRVNDIVFHPKKPGVLIVTISVDNGVPVSTSSVVELFEGSLLGGKSIQLILDHSNKELAKSRDTLKGRHKPGMTALLEQKLAPILTELEGTMSQANTMLSGVNEILDAEAKKNLQKSIAKLEGTMNDFSLSAAKLKGIMSKNENKLNGAIGNFEQITNDFADLSGNLAKSELDKTVAELQHTIGGLNTLLKKMEAGEGTLGKLMQDEKMYSNLTGASKELELLLEDLRINPKRYMHFSLFGKKQKPYDSQKVTAENNIQLK
ncbi:MAG: MlaD family protein [Flavobacteriaceae bacterium]|nr:MlaD family protein [Flavobacteriaceae bacterium]